MAPREWEQNPRKLSYSPGSYTTLGEDIQPSESYYYSPGSGSHLSSYLGGEGLYMSDEEWEAAKERALAPHGRTQVQARKGSQKRGHVRDVIEMMDEWRALNRDRPKVAAIPDQRRYWEDFIRRETERRRESVLEGGPSLPHPGMRP